MVGEKLFKGYFFQNVLKPYTNNQYFLMKTTDNIANITCERLNAEQKQC